MSTKTLAESGALRQLRHNDGSEGFVFAYDKDVTDRYVADLRAALAAATAPQPVAGDERAAFELEFPGVAGLWNGADYGENRCQRMWDVWQARAAQSARQIATLHAVIGELETELFWLKVPAVELPPSADAKIAEAMAVIDAARLKRQYREFAEAQRREVDRRGAGSTK